MGNAQGSYELSPKKPIGAKNEGDSSLGMESCAIPAARITASSSTDEGPAFFARLNGSKSWCAGSPADCFLEVDLDIAHYVSAVATQGNPIGNHDFVKKYKIQYSIDGMDWEYYKENYKEVLDGNSDYNTPAKRKLEPDIKARYVRFWPTAWFQWPCLRVEIYGRPAPPDKMTENGVVPIRLQSDDKQQGEDENEKITNGEVVPQDNTYTEQPEVKINATVYESDEEKEVAGQEIDLEFLNDEEVTDEDQEGNMKSAEKQNEDKTNESESEEEKEISGQEIDMEALNDIEVVSTDKTTDHLDDRLNVSDGENNTKKELNMDILNDIGVISTGENDVKETTDEISFRALVTSTPAKPKRLDVNKPDQENNNRVLAIKHNDADLKRLMDVKAKLELEADTRRRYGVELRKKKKRVTLEDDPPEYLHLPRRIYDDMWGDSPTSSVSEGLNNQDEKPLIEIQDGGAPLAKHEDDHIEETSDHQTPQAVTIRTVKKITTRIERHVGHNHLHDAHNHGHDHKDSGIVCSTSANVSHDAPADLFLSLNGFYSPAPYAAKASCEHLHPTDPVVQVAMESSFNERVDSMDQINIDALASRRFSGLDLLQSPYDAVSGEDIQRLLAWEDDTLPGWTRMKKSRDYEIFKGTAVDGGPPIIKTVITLKKIAYEEAVRRITDWKIRQEWDRTFDQITFIEESYNFNVLHCSTKNQGLTLAVMDDVDIDEPYHASVWSVADHPDSYSLSTGKPLRYDTMISGLVIRPTQDGFPSTRVTLLCQLKGSVSAPIKGTYLTGNPDRWIDMLKKYSSPKKISVKK